MSLSKLENQEAEVQPNGLYSSDYYAGQVNGALQSARVVLAILFDVYRPQSVFDLGCGQGAWLAAAEELGAKRIVGMDGPWVDPTAFISRKTEFSAVDFENEFVVREKYELGISVEVAEHISVGRSRLFVETLCSASDVVVFSAAIPQQGGVNHINEQKQSFWAQLFAAAGYECHDLFRPRLWGDIRVESWYRQNLLLYVRNSHPLASRLRSVSPDEKLMDIVHPEIYEGNLENYRRQIDHPSLRFCCKSFARWLKRKVNLNAGSTSD